MQFSPHSVQIDALEHVQRYYIDRRVHVAHRTPSSFNYATTCESQSVYFHILKGKEHTRW